LPSSREKIVFVSDRDGDAEIFVMHQDGSNLHQVTNNSVGDRHPSWSPDGSRIVFTRDGHGVYPDIYLMDADGRNQQPLIDHHASDMWPAWSPAGEWIAFQTNRDGNWDIYLVRSDGSNLYRLTSHPADDQMPAWSPDGERVIFQSGRGGIVQIYSVNALGGEEEHHVPSDFNYWGPKFSPSAEELAFYTADRDGNWEIYVQAGGILRRVTDADTEEKLPVWSPDGQWIAFVSSRNGKFGIYQISLDDVLFRDARDVNWVELVVGPGNNEDVAWWGP